MTKFYTALIATLLVTGASLSSLSSAYAANDLQEKAEEILESEPGAKQVTVREEIAPIKREGTKVIDFMTFDIDGDGALSRDEVGEKLFEIFDRDGNEVIDNIEMKKPSLLTFTTMNKKTTEIIEYYSDDTPQKTKVTQEEFLRKSHLGKFDKGDDGLSPLDFLGTTFYRVNVKNDGVIDLYEFKRAYAKSVKPLHEEDFNYND